MNTVTWTIIEFLVNMIEYAFVLLIPTFQLKTLRNGIKKWHIIGYIIICSILLFAYNHLTDNNISSMVPSLITAIIYVVYFTVGKWYAKTFWVIFVYSTAFFIERLVIDFVVDFYNRGLADILYQDKYRLIIMGVSKFIYLMIIFLSYRYRLRINKDARFLIFPIFVSLIVPVILLSVGSHMWHLTSIFLVINACYLGYFYHHDQMEKAKREREYLQLKKQNTLESMILREYMRQYQGDVNEKLKVIWDIMKENDTLEKGRITEDMYNVSLSLQRLYDTGDPDLDVVLSLKEATGDRQGIELKTRIMKPLPPNVNYADLSVIVGEVIDNAYAAVKRIPPEVDVDPLVVLTMGCTEEGIILDIENPTNGEIIPSQKILLSDKNTGYGLKTVNHIVNQYNGTFEIQSGEDYFLVVIEIPTSK